MANIHVYAMIAFAEIQGIYILRSFKTSGDAFRLSYSIAQSKVSPP